MKIKDVKRRGFVSKHNGRSLARLMLLKDDMVLRVSGVDIFRQPYADIKYLTVSWYGAIKVHCHDPKDNFTFWRILIADLLVACKRRGIKIEGNVRRGMLVSQLYVFVFYITGITLIMTLITLIAPTYGIRPDSEHIRQFIIFIGSYSVASVGAMTLRFMSDMKLNQDEKDDEWFKWG